MIPLEAVVYDPQARDGTWCCSPYPGHPRGCPNFRKGCIGKRPAFATISGAYRWFAVVETFDLKTHAEKMKEKHPGWSDRQCRNPLYWQGAVRANLRKKCLLCDGDILLDIPEANGINIFETMAKVGVILEKRPDIVRKIMIIGKRQVPPAGQQGGMRG